MQEVLNPGPLPEHAPVVGAGLCPAGLNPGTDSEPGECG